MAPAGAATKSQGISAVAHAGANTKSQGILTAAGESTIAAVNIGDVKLNDATTTSVNFTKVKNLYKKQAAVTPALCNSTVTSDVTVLHTATSVTASSVTQSNLSVTTSGATTGVLY